MQTQTTKIAVSMTSYDIDGQQGGSVYLVQPTSGRNPNICGHEVLKMKCDYDLATSKIEAQDGSLPGNFQILMRLERGTGGRARPVAISMRENKETSILLDVIKEAYKQKQPLDKDDQMTGLVIGATRYMINENQKGGRLYLLTQPDDIEQQAWAGFAVITVELDYDHFLQIKQYEKRLPSLLTIGYAMEHGAGDTPRILAKSISLYDPQGQQQSPAQTHQPTGKQDNPEVDPNTGEIKGTTANEVKKPPKV